MANDQWSASRRLGGLRRFAAAITILNILGHTILGFEQPYLQPLVSLAAAYATELLLELVRARAAQSRPAFLAAGPGGLVDFLLPAHISALAIAMLLYPGDRMGPVVVAAVIAIASKAVLQVRGADGTTRHFMNPSNAGIAAVLLMFPLVGIVAPYHFTERLDGAADWILPAIIICTGSFLNLRFTGRWPLIGAWLTGFATQAVVRSLMFGVSLPASLAPMTGVAFLLYTFYMITDPATSPSKPRSQVVFGASVAAVYGVLMAAHIVFGLFFALAVVCGLRGLMLLRAGAVRVRLPQLGTARLSPPMTPVPARYFADQVRTPEGAP